MLILAISGRGKSKEGSMRHIRLGLLSTLAMALTLGMALLVGCSSQPPAQSQRVVTLSERAHAVALTFWRSPEERHLATVHCSGGLQCRFTALNQMILLDGKTGIPTEAAQKAAVFRYESMSQQPYALYHLAVTEGLHELRLQFYPVTLERAEQFTLIHQFKAGREYQLRLFRDRQVQAGSLLAMAAPNPLCVDLAENQRVIRRFCRPFDPKTGLGEFIEAKLPT